MYIAPTNSNRPKSEAERNHYFSFPSLINTPGASAYPFPTAVVSYNTKRAASPTTVSAQDDLATIEPVFLVAVAGGAAAAGSAAGVVVPSA